MNLVDLYFQYRKARADARAILDASVAEGRSLTIPEQVCFDGLAARLQELDGAINERESLRKLAM
jgi:hypothetical protein